MPKKIKIADLETSKAFQELIDRKVKAQLEETQKAHEEEIKKFNEEIQALKDNKDYIELENENENQKPVEDLSDEELLDEIDKLIDSQN